MRLLLQSLSRMWFLVAVLAALPEANHSPNATLTLALITSTLTLNITLILVLTLTL